MDSSRNFFFFLTFYKSCFFLFFAVSCWNSTAHTHKFKRAFKESQSIDFTLIITTSFGIWVLKKKNCGGFFFRIWRKFSKFLELTSFFLCLKNFLKMKFYQGPPPPPFLSDPKSRTGGGGEGVVSVKSTDSVRQNGGGGRFC